MSNSVAMPTRSSLPPGRVILEEGKEPYFRRDAAPAVPPAAPPPEVPATETPTGPTSPQFKHFRDQGLTLAVVILKDDTIVVGVARCGRNDNFCRATGRKIALDRATSTKIGTKFRFFAHADEVMEVRNPAFPPELNWDAILHSVTYGCAVHNDNFSDPKKHWRLS